MKTRYSLSFFFILTSLSFIFVGCSSNNNNINTQQVPVAVEQHTVIIEGISYEADVPENSTALTLLQTVAEREGIKIDITGKGAQSFVNAIGDKVGGTDNKYWLYYVNGDWATVGAGAYFLKKEDTIEWKFE